MTNTQDEFAQSSNGYSTEKFYTASTDGSGGGTTIHVKVPNSVYGEAGALVAMRVFPDYRTSHDVVRDSFVHRLHDLSGMTKDPAALARIQAEQKHLIAVNALIERERMAAVDAEALRLSYSAIPSTQFNGARRDMADALLQTAIDNLDDRADLQAVLKGKL